MINWTSAFRAFNIFPRTLSYLSMSKNKNYEIEDLKTQWADEILRRLNIKTYIIGKPSPESSLVFVGNHISYLDIPLLVKSVPRLSFVAKKEVSRWPIIGSAASTINTVFVDRNNSYQRQTSRETIAHSLLQGRRVAIFPSGTTRVNEDQIWKKGAFEIAHQGNFKIQPFKIHYTPLRTAAYIDNDTLLFHLFKLSQQSIPLEAFIEFAPAVNVENPLAAAEAWRLWTQNKGHLLEAQM